MKTLSVYGQIEALRPSVKIGIASNLHKWLLAFSATSLLLAILFWHPVPFVIAIFFGIVGFSEQKAGPNITAAIDAYDSGKSSTGEVSIAITRWDTDNFYQAIVYEDGYSGWEYEFIPQGWYPVPGKYKAKIWRNADQGRPILVIVDEGILIPRYEPKIISA